jgi:hypothetical protein
MTIWPEDDLTAVFSLRLFPSSPANTANRLNAPFMWGNKAISRERLGSRADSGAEHRVEKFGLSTTINTRGMDDCKCIFNTNKRKFLS